MKAYRNISIDPAVMCGKPVIKGTRITVEHILRELGAGMTPEQILGEHTHLTLDNIREAQAFAADFLASEEVVFG